MKGLLTNDHTGVTSSMNTGLIGLLLVYGMLVWGYVTGRIDTLPDGLVETLGYAFGAKGISSIGGSIGNAILKNPNSLDTKVQSLFKVVKELKGKVK